MTVKTPTPADSRIRLVHMGDRMPEANQYTFTHQELVELMVKVAGVHEGKWTLAVQFIFTATSGGEDADSIVPGAFAGIAQLGIQRAPVDAINNLTVDAAVINPK
jgi:hypothetical protein